MAAAPLPHVIGSKAPCVVDEYVADFTAKSNGEVEATLTIRYFVYDDPKTDGFKFLGTRPVENITVSDGEGRPLKWKREQHRETLVRFFFDTPIKYGPASVVIKFLLPRTLEGDQSNTFNGDWVGNFRIPVRKSIYRFSLPASHSASSFTSQPKGVRKSKGIESIEVVQEPHRQTAFTVSFQPPLVKRAAQGSMVKSQPSAASTMRSVGCTIAAIVSMFLIIFGLSRCNPGSSSGGSSGYSSCSSSSCSSGSSCGGGCGGGCGGCGGG